MKEPIIKLMNDNIMSIDTDNDHHSGCETCDYGSEYINIISITTEKNGVFRLEINQMYEYALSDYGLLMKLGCDVAVKSAKMTLREALLYIQKEILKECAKPYRYEGMGEDEYEKRHKENLMKVVKHYFVEE